VAPEIEPEPLDLTTRPTGGQNKLWEPSMESSRMLRTLITDPQQYYSAILRCYAAPGKHEAHLSHTCDVTDHGKYVTYTSQVTQEHQQPIARLHVAGYFCIISIIYKKSDIRQIFPQAISCILFLFLRSNYCPQNDLKHKQCSSLHQMAEWYTYTK
jgi:hypothetical protein